VGFHSTYPLFYPSLLCSFEANTLVTVVADRP